jgi:hypothetical protein
MVDPAALKGLLDIGNSLLGFASAISKASSEKRVRFAKYLIAVADNIEKLAAAVNSENKLDVARLCAHLEANATYGAQLLGDFVSFELAREIAAQLASYARTLSVPPTFLGMESQKHRDDALVQLVMTSGRLHALGQILEATTLNKKRFSEWQRIQSTALGANFRRSGDQTRIYRNGEIFSVLIRRCIPWLRFNKR